MTSRKQEFTGDCEILFTYSNHIKLGNVRDNRNFQKNYKKFRYANLRLKNKPEIFHDQLFYKICCKNELETSKESNPIKYCVASRNYDNKVYVIHSTIQPGLLNHKYIFNHPSYLINFLVINISFFYTRNKLEKGVQRFKYGKLLAR